MNNDRELLELAAKAAGYTDCIYVDGFGMAMHGAVFHDGKPVITWNPLIDDGDALRLAVKCLNFYTLQYSDEDWEHCNHDGYAATRRAIVRAAAEIGKGLHPFPTTEEIEQFANTNHLPEWMK
jgi:hypothetical protein